LTIYLGYRLFLFGAQKGKTEMSVKSQLLSFTLHGQLPGLFFMLCGSFVLALALFIGKVTTEMEEWPSPTPNDGIRQTPEQPGRKKVNVRVTDSDRRKPLGVVAPVTMVMFGIGGLALLRRRRRRRKDT
jgi:hypothetical protein